MSHFTEVILIQNFWAPVRLRCLKIGQILLYCIIKQRQFTKKNISISYIEKKWISILKYYPNLAYFSGTFFSVVFDLAFLPSKWFYIKKMSIPSSSERLKIQKKIMNEIFFLFSMSSTALIQTTGWDMFSTFFRF